MSAYETAWKLFMTAKKQLKAVYQKLRGCLSPDNRCQIVQARPAFLPPSIQDLKDLQISLKV